MIEQSTVLDRQGNTSVHIHVNIKHLGNCLISFARFVKRLLDRPTIDENIVRGRVIELKQKGGIREVLKRDWKYGIRD